MQASSGKVEHQAEQDRSSARQRLLQRARSRLLDRLPSTWDEKELDVAKWKLDKAFACAWLDAQRVLVATKCNQLLEVDVRTGHKVSVELPPEPSAREHTTVDSGWGFCGIHSIDINPVGDLIVTGGRNPTDAVVMRLSDYKPVQTLTGHLDWVFGAAWVSDRHLVTGSRDGAMALWNIQQQEEYSVLRKDFNNKKDMKRKFKGRVRDIKYDYGTDRVAALGTEGCIKLFDMERDFRITRTVDLAHTKELVCLAQRADVLAAGSCGHVTVADPRRRQAEVLVMHSPDGGQGVRSVMLQDHLLSFGTGRGKIVFVDMRKWEPLQLDGAAQVLHHEGPYEGTMAVEQEPPVHPMKPSSYLECGSGWLQQDELYWDHFVGTDVRNACYAHAWDPTGSRLFACGGPLAFGLKGCYMALWR
ncbi:hypothetical protein N2152v2_005558 [Parachlorella kessleri]